MIKKTVIPNYDNVFLFTKTNVYKKNLTSLKPCLAFSAILVYLVKTYPSIIEYIRILLTVAPVITTNPVDQEVSIFNSFTINCTAKGSPIPSILWYLNNDLITNTDNRIIISTTTITQHSVTSTLTISSARYTDAGVYYCQTDGDNLNVETADISRYNSEIKYQNKISDSRLSVVSHSAAVTVVGKVH